MSFAADNEDELQNQSQTEQIQNQNDISLGGGGSGVASPGGGGNVGGAQAPKVQSQEAGKPSSSGSWTNLQSYLDANSDQSSQLGSQIAGSVTNQAETAKNEVNQASNDFNKQVEDNTVQANPDQVSQALSDATGAKADSTYSQSDLDNFQKQFGASYNGPTDFTATSGYGQAQGDVNKAAQSLSELGSESGRDVLLKNQFQNTSENGYNQGETNLDQLLLENNPSNQAAFSGLRNQYTGIDKALSNATATNNAAAASAMQTDQATAAAAKAAFDQANSGFQTSLNAQAQDAIKNYNSDISSYKNALQNQGLLPEQWAALGVAPGTHTYGLSGQQLSDYITPGLVPTLYNTATADQYAQAAALAKLGGIANYLPSQYASQAGAAKTPFTFNNARFNSDAQAQHQSLTNEALDRLHAMFPGGIGVNDQNYTNVLPFFADQNGHESQDTKDFFQNLINELNQTIGG